MRSTFVTVFAVEAIRDDFRDRLLALDQSFEDGWGNDFAGSDARCRAI